MHHDLIDIIQQMLKEHFSHEEECAITRSPEGTVIIAGGNEQISVLFRKDGVVIMIFDTATSCLTGHELYYASPIFFDQLIDTVSAAYYKELI